MPSYLTLVGSPVPLRLICDGDPINQTRSIQWSEYHAAIAARQGWGLFLNRKINKYEIGALNQWGVGMAHVDSPPPFSGNDVAAINCVKEQASRGYQVAIDAIEFLWHNRAPDVDNYYLLYSLPRTHRLRP